MRPGPAVFLLVLAIVPALAQAASVPLPRPRPDPAAVSGPGLAAPWFPSNLRGPAAPPEPEPAADRPGAAPAGDTTTPLPRPRPNPQALAPAPVPDKAGSSTPAEPGTAATAEPAAPPRVYQTACPAVLAGQVEAKALPPIHEGPDNQCGLQSPLSVTAVFANGRSIPLSGAATLDCGIASTLPAWFAEMDRYVLAHEKTTIAKVIVSTSYMCRNVDNAAVGNLSFHAFADGLDVIGFELADGRTVMLEQAWRGTTEQGKDIWHFARDSACTHFTTVLGPEADSFHQNNLHVDLGCHGKTCTARLCE